MVRTSSSSYSGSDVIAVGVLRLTIMVPLLFLLSNLGRESLLFCANSSSLAVELLSEEEGEGG
jgi:hypothetical protein